jgi:molybdopterin-guanine dinucleotide biosynthesis protein A
MFAAIVLAGGAARRLGGVAKPAQLVGGVALLTRVLRAVVDADPVVVVGPPSLAPLLPPHARRIQEEPAGAGPVSAANTGVRLLSSGRVALLAADLPFLTPVALAQLRAAQPGHDGAILVDDDGRPQWMAGVWSVDRLAPRLAQAAAGASLRSTMDGLDIAYVTAAGPAWFDCDTPADLDTARAMSDDIG